MDMKIKVQPLGKNVTMTKDNVKLTIDASVAYRVTNPVIAYYVLGTIFSIFKAPTSTELSINQQPAVYVRP